MTTNTKSELAHKYADQLREKAENYDEIGAIDLIDTLEVDWEMRELVMDILMGLNDD
jgi:hypothetical protein